MAAAHWQQIERALQCGSPLLYLLPTASLWSAAFACGASAIVGTVAGTQP